MVQPTSQVSVVQQCTAFKRGRRFGRWHKREFILLSNGLLTNRRIRPGKLDMESVLGVKDLASAETCKVNKKKIPKRLQRRLKKLESSYIRNSTVVSRKIETIKKGKDELYVFTIHNMEHNVQRTIGLKIKGHAEALLKAIQRFSDPGLDSEVPQPTVVPEADISGEKTNENSAKNDSVSRVGSIRHVDGLILPQPLTGIEWEEEMLRTFSTNNGTRLSTAPIRNWSQDFYLANHHSVGSQNNSFTSPLLDRGLNSFKLWKQFTLYSSAILAEYIRDPVALRQRDESGKIPIFNTSTIDAVVIGKVVFCFVKREFRTVPGPKPVSGTSTPAASIEGLVGMYHGTQAYQICSDYVARVNGSLESTDTPNHVRYPTFFTDLKLPSTRSGANRTNSPVHPVLDPSPPVVTVIQSDDVTCIAFHSPRWIQNSGIEETGGESSIRKRLTSMFKRASSSETNQNTLNHRSPKHPTQMNRQRTNSQSSKTAVANPQSSTTTSTTSSDQLNDNRNQTNEIEEGPQFPLLPDALRLSIANWTDSSHAPLLIPVMQKSTTRACKALLLHPDPADLQEEPQARFRSTTEVARDVEMTRRSRLTAARNTSDTAEPNGKYDYPHVPARDTSAKSSGAGGGENHAKQVRAVRQSFRNLTTLDVEISVQDSELWLHQVMSSLGISNQVSLCGFQDTVSGMLFYYSLHRTNQEYNEQASHLAGCSLYGPVLVIWPVYPFPFLPPETVLHFPEAVEAYGRSMLEKQGRGIGHLRQARIVTVEHSTCMVRSLVKSILSLPKVNVHLHTSLPRASLIQNRSQVVSLLRNYSLDEHNFQALCDRLIWSDSKLHQTGGLPSARTEGQRVNQLLAVQAIASAATKVLTVRIAHARTHDDEYEFYDEDWGGDTTNNTTSGMQDIWPKQNNNAPTSSSFRSAYEEQQSDTKSKYNRVQIAHVKLFNDMFSHSSFLRSKLWKNEIPAMLALGTIDSQVRVLPQWLTSWVEADSPITVWELETLVEAMFESFFFAPSTSFMARIARFFSALPSTNFIDGLPFEVSADEFFGLSLPTMVDVQSDTGYTFLHATQPEAEDFHVRRLARLAQQCHVEQTSCTSDAHHVLQRRQIMKGVKDSKATQTGYLDPSLRYARALNKGVQQDWHPVCHNEGDYCDEDEVPWCDGDERATARISSYALLVDTVFQHMNETTLSGKQNPSHRSTSTTNSHKVRNESVFESPWSNAMFWSNAITLGDKPSQGGWMATVLQRFVQHSNVVYTNRGDHPSPASAVAAAAKQHSLKKTDLLKHLQVRSVVSWIRVSFWHAICTITTQSRSVDASKAAHQRSLDCIDRALQILSGSCCNVKRNKLPSRCFPGEVVLLCQGLRSALALSSSVTALENASENSNDDNSLVHLASEALGSAGEVVALIASCLDIAKQLASEEKTSSPFRIGSKSSNTSLSHDHTIALEQHMMVLAITLLQWLQSVAPKLHRYGGPELGNALTRGTHNEVVRDGSLTGRGTSEHLCLERLSRLIAIAKFRLEKLKQQDENVTPLSCHCIEHGTTGIEQLLLGCGQCDFCGSKRSSVEPIGPLSGLVAFVGNVEPDSPFGFRSASVLRAGVLDRDRYLLSDLETKYFLDEQSTRIANSLSVYNSELPGQAISSPRSLVKTVRSSAINHKHTTTTVYTWGTLQGMSIEEEQRARASGRPPVSSTVEESPDIITQADPDLIGMKLDRFPHRGVGVSSVSCGHRHTAMVTDGGLLLTFGHGETGRLGHGDEVSVLVPKVVQSLVAANVFVTSVACGREHTVAIGEMCLPVTKGSTLQVGSASRKVAGLAFSWGWGEAGRLGVGDMGVQPYPILVESLAFAQGLRQIGGAGGMSTAGSVASRYVSGNASVGTGALRHQHQIGFTPKSAFSNNTSRTGRGKRNGWDAGHSARHLMDSNTPGLYYHNLAQRLRVKLGLLGGTQLDPSVLDSSDLVSETDFLEDASVATSTAFANTVSSSVASGGPMIVTHLDHTVELAHVACGREHTLCTGKNGKVYVFGAGAQGRLGNGSDEDCTYPVMLSSAPIVNEHVIACAAGDAHSLALLQTGEVLSWGFGASGALGHGDTKDVSLPRKILHFVKAGVKLCDIACGAYHSAAVDTDGRVWTWGDGEDGQLGVPNQGNPETHRAELPTLVTLPSESSEQSPPLLSRAVSLDCSSATTVVTTNKGKAFVWGTPELANVEPQQLRERMMVPRAYSVADKLVSVACGGYHAIGLANSPVPLPPNQLDTVTDTEVGIAEPVVEEIAQDDIDEQETGSQNTNTIDDEDDPIEIWNDDAWLEHVLKLNEMKGKGILKQSTTSTIEEGSSSDVKPLQVGGFEIQQSMICSRVYVTGWIGTGSTDGVSNDGAAGTNGKVSPDSVERLARHYQSYNGNGIRWEELGTLGVINPDRCSCETCNLSHGVWPHASATDAAIREGFWYDDDGSGNSLLESNSRAASSMKHSVQQSRKHNRARSSISSISPNPSYSVFPERVLELEAKEILNGSRGMGTTFLPVVDGMSVYRFQQGWQDPCGRAAGKPNGEFQTTQELAFGDIRVHDIASNTYGLVATLASVSGVKRPQNITQNSGGHVLMLFGEIPFTSGESKSSGNKHCDEQPYAPFTLPATVWRPGSSKTSSKHGQPSTKKEHILEQVSTGGDRLVVVVDGKLYQLKFEHRKSGREDQQQILSLKQALQSLEIVAPPHSNVGDSIHGDELLNSKSFSSVPVETNRVRNIQKPQDVASHSGDNENNAHDSGSRRNSQSIVMKEDGLTLDINSDTDPIGSVEVRNPTPPAHKRRAKYYLKAIKNYSKSRRRRRKLNVRMPLTRTGARGFEFREATSQELLMFRTILRAQNIYHKYSAVQLKPAFFQKLVHQFHGREHELITKLETKYGPEPPMLSMEGPTGWARTVPTPLRCASLEGRVVVQVATGAKHAMALCSQGRVFAWGVAEYGRLGLDYSAISTTGQYTGSYAGPKQAGVATRGSQSSVSSLDGSGYQSNPKHGSLYQTYGSIVVEEPHIVHLRKVEGDSSQSRVGISLGFGSSKNIVEQPVVTQISCGGAHSGAVTADGELYMWGGGGWGQIGHGKREHALLPVRIAIPELVSTLRVQESIAKLEPATRESGENAGFKLSTRKVTTQPVARKVVCGKSHTVVVTNCGHALSFGRGLHGRLGLGDEMDRLFPCWVELKEQQQVPISRNDLQFGSVTIPVVARVYDAYAGVQHSLFISRSVQFDTR